LEVIVDDTQLSLAIGKKGQNVRLAAKLLGWKIDIKSEEEKRQEVEQQMQALTGGPSTPIEQVTELGDGIIQKLVAAGITTVEGLADMTPEQLEEIPGIGEKTLEKISVAVRHYFGQFEEGEEGRAPAGEATLGTDAAEAENAASVIGEVEQERASEEENPDIRTEAEAAVEDAPAAGEAEVETLEDSPAEHEKLEETAIDAEPNERADEEQGA